MGMGRHGFSLLAMWLYPTFLAPLFNKFAPLEKGPLQDAIFALAKKVDFKTAGIFIMDASRRSSHGNAYFTGIFKEKRIVLFDTLVKSLTPEELVAVLAHELGHCKLHHIRNALLRNIAMTGVIFFLLSRCWQLEAFYQAFSLAGISTYGALVVFSLWFGLVDFFLTPIGSWMSRCNEFAADAFAKQHLPASALLRTALIKLRESNHGMPLAHPLFSFFYYSHPPLMERLRAL
jgi:STE24 endopeptidase